MPETREQRLEAALRDAIALLDHRKRGFDPTVSIGDLTKQIVTESDAALATPPDADPRDARIAQLEEALREVIGDHNAPGDCFSTGPLTGDPLRDARCPACAASRILTGSTTEWLESKIAEAKTEAVVAYIEMLKKGMTRATELEGGKG